MKKRDGGAPKDSNDIDASERANVGGEKEVKKPVKSEDNVAKQVITSDTDKDQNTQKPECRSKSEHQKGATKARKNHGENGNSIGEKAVDCEDNVVKQGVTPECPCENFGNGDVGASGEQITGNGVGETEGVSDGTPAEPIKNCDDNNSVDETAEKGNNSGAEKELDAVKQGQHITNSDESSKSPDEMAEMANGVCKKTVQVEGDLVKQGITYDGESGEQTKNHDDDNVMIGENIDESKAHLDATQKPNINLDLGVKREIVGISIDLDGGHSWHDKTPPLNLK